MSCSLGLPRLAFHAPQYLIVGFFYYVPCTEAVPVPVPVPVPGVGVGVGGWLSVAARGLRVVWVRTLLTPL